jgi:2,3-bisphosphoglycerate-independent phosphoglycerate mutase
MKYQKPTLLIILDGFGHADKDPYNAITLAHAPALSAWSKHYPITYLSAAGPAVGIPSGYMGNSEVGHITIGAGRRVKQPLMVINEAIADHSLWQHPILEAHFKLLAQHHKPLHILGLLSDAGVHSSFDHLIAYVKIARHYNVPQVYVHAFLDGRDVAPRSASYYLRELGTFFKQENFGILASLHGRFYAMDRDNNWDRTQKSYEVLTVPHQTIRFNDWHEVLDYYYAQGISDEYIPPTPLIASGTIQEGDGILCGNFRPDRSRQLIACFASTQVHHIAHYLLPLTSIITPYSYGTTIPTQYLFERPVVTNTLKEVLDAHQIRMFSIAETEKYAHITYFFNGEKEEKLPHETRVLIPSLKVATYADYSCMSAPAITDAVINALHQQEHGFYLINYANADMVGHSGNLKATIAAIECLDKELKRLYDVAITTYHATMFITADHGKAEKMFDPITQQAYTAHTDNPVPFIAINESARGMNIAALTELADIAPYVLTYLGIPVPAEMGRYMV